MRPRTARTCFDLKGELSRSLIAAGGGAIGWDLLLEAQ